MIDDPRVPGQPAPGPQDTVRTTPPIPDGGIRRTMSADMTRPDGPGGTVTAVLRGRDARDANGRVVVVDEVAGTVSVDELSGITAVDLDGGASTVPELVGLTLFGGWGRAMAARLPPERTLLVSMLEDLGGAYLVSGYTPLRAGLLAIDPDDAPAHAANQADVCIGWAADGDLVRVLATTGHNAVPVGPVAGPDLFATGWHEVGAAPLHTVRRVRRLDVVPDGDGLVLGAHFRDSYAGDTEMVMHEYTVDATVGADGRLATIDVGARVLPWESCPGAVASASQVIGVGVDDLADRARRDLRGPTTCTHLSSTVRSLADTSTLRRSP